MTPASFPPASLTKRTKGEILVEYEKLFAELEAARDAARVVYDPGSAQKLARSAQASDGLLTSTQALRTTVNDSLNTITTAMAAEADRLRELREAAALVQKQLELHRHIAIATDTAEKLAKEAEAKRRQVEADATRRTFEIEAELDEKRRAWERERSDREFQEMTKLKRERAVFEEETKRRELALQERQDALKRQEAEIALLRKQREEIPATVEKMVQEREKDIRQRIQAEFDVKFKQAKQEWEAEKNILSLRIQNLQHLLDRQQGDLAALKQEADRANARVQELVLRIVETGRAIPHPGEEVFPEREASR